MQIAGAVAFKIFGLSIYWYAVIIMVGIMLAVILAMVSAKKYNWTADNIVDVALWAIPLAIVGARLYYVIFNWQIFSGDIVSILNTRKGGLAIYGGIIAGLIVAVAFCAKRKRSFWQLFDIAAPSIALGQAIGRWGNFVNQEAFGAVVKSDGLKWFPASVFIEQTGQFHYATFFYESIWCFLIVIVILAVRKKLKHKGDAGLLYLMLYAFERAFVEGLRTDSLMVGSIRVSQALSILLFVAILLYFIIRSVREKGSRAVITNVCNPAYVRGTDPMLEEHDNDEPEPKHKRRRRSSSISDESLKHSKGENHDNHIN